MKKSLLLVFVLFSFVANSFAYTHTYEDNPYKCSLQNLIKPNSCKPQYMWNDKYKCYAIPYITVGGEPVCRS